MPRKKAKPIPPSKMELDYAKFGDLLRELIRAQGYTQAAFADAVGISYPYMMDILKGTRRIYLHLYLKMMDVLEITDIALLSTHLSQKQVQEDSQAMLELMPLLNQMSAETINDLLQVARRLAREASEQKDDPF